MGCCGSRVKENQESDKNFPQNIQNLVKQNQSNKNQLLESDSTSVTSEFYFQGVLKQVENQQQQQQQNEKENNMKKYILYTTQTLQVGQENQIIVKLEEDNAQNKIIFSQLHLDSQTDQQQQINFDPKYQENMEKLQQQFKEIETQILLNSLELTDNNYEKSLEIQNTNKNILVQEKFFKADDSHSQLLQQFKEIVQQLKIINKENNNNIPYNIYIPSQESYMRFLKSRDYDLEDALEMYQNYIQWRFDNKVDFIKQIEFPELPQVKQIFKHGYHNTDKLGRPIYIEVLTGLNYDDMIKAEEDSEKGIMTKERIGQYFIQQFENLVNTIFPQCSQIQGKQINQMIRIIDMKNYKLKPNQIQDFLKLSQNIVQDNYPEILGQLYIINASAMFKLSWKGIQYILPEATKQKIQVLGKDFGNQLFKIIDKSQFPEFLGGQCECEGGCLQKDIGNWQQQEEQNLENMVNNQIQEENQFNQEISNIKNDEN